MIKKLKCASCGGNLDFSQASNIVNCTFCGTPNAIVGEGSERRRVSYFPLPEVNGKTQTPLLLQIASFIEEETDFYPAPCQYSGNDVGSFEVNDNGEISRTLSVSASNGKFSICQVTPQKSEEKVRKQAENKGLLSLIVGNLSGTSNNYEVKEVVIGLKVIGFATLYVVPVLDGPENSGVLVGHRVGISVKHESWVEDVDAVSMLIKDHFKIIPEVELANI